MRTVRFVMPPAEAPAPAPHRPRIALLTGCLLAGAGVVLTPDQNRLPEASPRVKAPPPVAQKTIETRASIRPPAPMAAPPERAGPAAAPRAIAAVPAAPPRPAPVVVAPSRAAAPAVRDPAAFPPPPFPPAFAPRTESPPLAGILPAASAAAPPVPIGDIAPGVPPASFEPGPADIIQLGAFEPPSPYLPQLTLPGRGAMAHDGTGIAFVADAAQLPATPALSREQRTALLVDAPTELALVVDGRRVGDVAIRMAGENRVEVQVASLLTLLSDRFDAGEYAALRGAAAADAFVGFDQLRAAGIELRYDPVYDEISLAA